MRDSDCEIFFKSLRSRSRVRNSSACSSSMVARSAGSGTIEVSSRKCSVVSTALDSRSSFSDCRRARKNSSCLSFMYSASGIASSSSSVSSRPDLFFHALARRGSALIAGRTASTGSVSTRCGGRGGAKRSVKRLLAAVVAGLASGLSVLLGKVLGAGRGAGGTGFGLVTPIGAAAALSGFGAEAGLLSIAPRTGVLLGSLAGATCLVLDAIGLVPAFALALAGALVGALAGALTGVLPALAAGLAEAL